MTETAKFGGMLYFENRSIDLPLAVNSSGNSQAFTCSQFFDCTTFDKN